MNRFSFGIQLLVLVAFTSACSGQPATPTSPSGGNGSLALTAGQLAGTWRLTSMQVAGQAAQSVPADATYTATFDGDRMSTRADCNTCSGGVTVSGNTVTIGPNMACTRAACPTMAFEMSYTTVLGGVSTAALSGNTLVLSSTRGVLSFTK